MTYSNLAYSNVKLGKIAEAESFARKSIELNPKWAEAHYNLALCCIASQKYADARVELETARTLDDELVLPRLIAKRLEEISRLEAQLNAT